MPEYVPYADYYDFAHDRKDDVEFYLDYARQCGSPILELACGTGRVLVPLAKAGFQIHGLDFSEEMLSRCRSRIERHGVEDRIALTCADMSAFDLERKDFVLALIPLRSFAHLFTQEHQISCMRRIDGHLRPGGVLIIAHFALRYSALAKEDAEPFIVRGEFDMPNGNHVIQKERFVSHDLAKQILHFQLRFEESDPGGQLVSQVDAPMDLRYVSRYELQLLFATAGFKVIDVFRDYQRTPYDGTWEMIMVGRKPA